MVLRSVSGLVLAAGFCAAFGGPAAAADNFQTDIGAVPLNSPNRANVVGRGSVKATLDGNKFTLHGNFAGLATPATDAHLCLGNVMGGAGPIIYDLTVSQERSGALSGTVTLTPEQIEALKDGKIYVLLASEKAPVPKGNLWGWFQPAHKTVAPDVPEEGHWYVPNILKDKPATTTVKKTVEVIRPDHFKS